MAYAIHKSKVLSGNDYQVVKFSMQINEIEVSDCNCELRVYT